MNNLLNTELDYQDLVSKFGSPLLVLDKATVRHQYQALKAALPGVVTAHCAIDEAIHDRELIIVLLNDYSL